MEYIDDQIESLNSWEERHTPKPYVQDSPKGVGKTLVGTVDQFFDRINVAAINLTSSLKVGDIIEIGSEEEAIRQKVSSMQIEREDVSEAGEGASIGIKLKYKVSAGSQVYKIE